MTKDEFKKRIEELKLLKDGWLDNKGLALDVAGIDWLSEKLEEKQLFPFLYPTEDGNIRAEWDFPEQDVAISLEVNLKSHFGLWHSYFNCDIDNCDNKLDKIRRMYRKQARLDKIDEYLNFNLDDLNCWIIIKEKINEEIKWSTSDLHQVIINIMKS